METNLDLRNPNKIYVNLNVNLKKGSRKNVIPLRQLNVAILKGLIPLANSAELAIFWRIGHF